jgi:hypothetical protein
MAARGETVLFLGAGATRPFGIPLTAEILPRMLERMEEGTLFGRGRAARVQAALIRKRLHAFLPGVGRPGVEPPLITDLLSLVDHMASAGQAARGDVGPQELAELRRRLEHGLAEVLAAEVDKRRRHDGMLGRFVDWILALAANGGLTLISTNYDVVVEQELYRRMKRGHLAADVDFGVSWHALPGGGRNERPARPRLRLLKLHGSLDWLRCPACEHLYIHPARTVVRREAKGDGVTCVCGYAPLRHVIVAPSMVRDVRDASLLAIWQSALEGLRRARHWVVIGYSMPPEDVAIHSMFVRALGGRRQSPRFVLVQRRDAGDAVNRFRLLLPDLQLISGGLEELMAGRGHPHPIPLPPAEGEGNALSIPGGLRGLSTSSPRRPTRGRSRRGSPSRSG